MATFLPIKEEVVNGHGLVLPIASVQAHQVEIIWASFDPTHQGTNLKVASGSSRSLDDVVWSCPSRNQFESCKQIP